MLNKQEVESGRGSVADGSRPRRGQPGAPYRAKAVEPRVSPGIAGRELDGPDPDHEPSRTGWVDLLDTAARTCLALALTVGFGMAVTLAANRPMTDPTTIRACSWFFVWCLLVVMAGSRGDGGDAFRPKPKNDAGGEFPTGVEEEEFGLDRMP
jgi:hypothetical protein